MFLFVFTFINRSFIIESMKIIDKASKILGSQAALAKALGVEPMAVSHWRTRGVPVGRCKAIEEATGGQVTRSELRPDVFA